MRDYIIGWVGGNLITLLILALVIARDISRARVTPRRQRDRGMS